MFHMEKIGYNVQCFMLIPGQKLNHENSLIVFKFCRINQLVSSSCNLVVPMLPLSSVLYTGYQLLREYNSKFFSKLSRPGISILLSICLCILYLVPIRPVTGCARTLPSLLKSHVPRNKLVIVPFLHQGLAFGINCPQTSGALEV